jgi:hypothetical protein
LENSLNVVPSISVPVAKEALHIRHKRDASDPVGLYQTTPMDGSGATDEGNKFFLTYYFLRRKKNVENI